MHTFISVASIILIQILRKKLVYVYMLYNAALYPYFILAE